jgi:hypothetical protein
VPKEFIEGKEQLRNFEIAKSNFPISKFKIPKFN